MTPEIEEFGKALVRMVRDESIQSNDRGLLANAKGPAATRWREAARDRSSEAFARAIIPDIVDETIFYLLHAIDTGELQLSYKASNGVVVDLTTDGELPAGSWAATAGVRCTPPNDSSMIR